MTQQYFFEMTITQLQSLIANQGGKPFVAKQLWNWVYQQFATDFDAMHTLPKGLRKTLKPILQISPFKSIQRIEDPDGLATKLILECWDTLKIEAVILKEERYDSLCISSQCGCPADCKFCLTGVMGFKRQLTVQEIVGQFVIAKQINPKISRIIFMGMGEPMLNIDNVLASIQTLTHETQFNISNRRITVSTVGYLAGLKALIESGVILNLAFSVGSALPQKRQIIMPFEKRNPILEITKLLKTYLNTHNRKLTLEYTLLKGVNDTPMDAKALSQLALFLNAKVNLINLNPHERIPFASLDGRQVNQFKEQLQKEKVPVTVRFRKGQKIAAACGQLGESHLGTS